MDKLNRYAMQTLLGFLVLSLVGGSAPLQAQDFSLFVGPTGSVGVGTSTPSSPLHVLRADGTAQLFIEETNPTTANRILFNMENNGSVQLQFTNTLSSSTWIFANGSGGVFRINDPNSTGLEMELQPDGDLIIEGALTTTGATCNTTPCDQVFEDPDLHVESIEDHAESMWANRHLPAVGPTSPDAPFNVSQKTAGMLNELEKAHIYIEQLHGRLQQGEEELAQQRQEIESLRQMVEGLTRAKSRP